MYKLSYVVCGFFCRTSRCVLVERFGPTWHNLLVSKYPWCWLCPMSAASFGDLKPKAVTRDTKVTNILSSEKSPIASHQHFFKRSFWDPRKLRQERKNSECVAYQQSTQNFTINYNIRAGCPNVPSVPPNAAGRESLRLLSAAKATAENSHNHKTQLIHRSIDSFLPFFLPSFLPSFLYLTCSFVHIRLFDTRGKTVLMKAFEKS